MILHVLFSFLKNFLSQVDLTLCLVNPVIAGEMDGNRSGKVGFRDFLFALTDWVGLDSDDEIPIS